MERGQFQPFLYNNLRLGAPEGMEGKVYPINARKTADHVVGYYHFSADELAEINKTGGLWISFMAQTWPPVGVWADIPQLYPTDLIVAGEELKSGGILSRLSYLDLNLWILDLPETYGSFSWKHLPKSVHNADGDLLDMWDLQYRERNLDALHGPVESDLKGGRYLFCECLDIAGRLGDLPRLQPLKLLYPSLRDDHLILMHKQHEDPPPILGADGTRLN